jgi:hypothetical protein
MPADEMPVDKTHAASNFYMFLCSISSCKVSFCRLLLCECHYASVIMRVSLCECHYASVIMPVSLCECHYASFIMQVPLCGYQYASVIMSMSLYECHFAEWHHAKCHYSECQGVLIISFALFLGKLNKGPGLLAKFGQVGKPVNGGRVAKMGGASRHQSCPLISYFMLVVSQRQYLKFKNMFQLITKQKYFYFLQLSILLTMRYVLMR